MWLSTVSYRPHTKKSFTLKAACTHTDTHPSQHFILSSIYYWGSFCVQYLLTLQQMGDLLYFLVPSCLEIN